MTEDQRIHIVSLMHEYAIATVNFSHFPNDDWLEQKTNAMLAMVKYLESIE